MATVQQRSGGMRGSAGFERVIVPTDGGAGHTRAALLARELARRLDIPLELRWVVGEGSADADQFELQHWAREIGDDVVANTVVGDDVFGELERVAQDPASLLCLPSSGRLAITELFSGSLSARVLATATRPIVVIGPHCGSDLRGTRMAIAVDDSTESEAIVDDAHDLAVALGLVGRLVHVSDDVARCESVCDHLTSLRARHLVDGRPPLEIAVRVDDDPVGGLERLLADDEVAMVALASRGMDARHRLRDPAMSHRLIRHARFPVLVGHR